MPAQLGLALLLLSGLLRAAPTFRPTNHSQPAYYDYDQFELTDGEFPADDYYYANEHIFSDNDQDTALSDDFLMHAAAKAIASNSSAAATQPTRRTQSGEGPYQQASTVAVSGLASPSAYSARLLVSLCVAAIGLVILTFLAGLVLRHKRLLRSNAAAGQHAACAKKAPQSQEYRPIEQAYV